MKKLRIVLVLSALIYLAYTVVELYQKKDFKADEFKESELHLCKDSPEKAPELLEKKETKDKAYDFTEEESELLCKIAMAEAGNQDTEGKALVMLVVLNRVKEGGWFPDTIKGVIYQPSQFSPVLEGKFEKTIPNEDCLRALNLVQEGWDESRGALYFESESASTWHQDNLELLFQHQDHYFYAERK